MKDGLCLSKYRCWIIAAGSFLVFAITIGFGYNCWSIFTIPICEELELTRQQFSVLFTALLAGQTLGTLATPTLIRKLGMMPFMRAGIAATAASMLLASRIQSTFGLYISGLLVGTFLCAASFLPFSILVSNWFVRMRGLITGFVFMGSGLGSMALLPLVNRWIVDLGWRRAILVMALIVAAVALPLSFLLVNDPQELGLLPYGWGEDAEMTSQSDDSWGLTGREAVRQPFFWLFLAFMLGMYLEISLAETTVPYLSDVGFSSDTAVIVQSMCMGTLAVMRLLAGQMCDRLGVVKATAILSAAAPLLAMGLLAAPAVPAAVVLVVLGQGIGESSTTVCCPMIVGHLFGRKHYANIYGIITAFSYLIGALAPILFGTIHTQCGSYRPAYWIFSGIFFVGMICFYIAVDRRKNIETSDVVP